ncbi:MAG: sigma-70 family RNA polymerase sigma factor [Cyanomargarita calcarea GSE-NOS-MK-12-04C]|jgi:DNA-directed RNA polymerase specialized sigma24 family protein|uniref:Sigma-70 family RNA polymerase sigma factor n=1 Tax=Cyanomargarita calcarea GSE-NOS-MK-12-04C TaxID=2839659 RepID=A0A951QVB5_9CYAN|nr:sigma-70 family RNA polymerase sigma factor [Cyanomargarita calcarea GSE-NOS-MK-12-04C]
MVRLEEQLSRLVEQACRQPPGSPERQKLLTQIIRLSAGKLWKESNLYYQDALQQTWLYFCRNICEGTTGQVYNSSLSSVITWLNVYLRRRLQDFYRIQQRQQARTVSTSVYQSASGDMSEALDPVDMLVAPPETPPILDNVRMWVETDSNGELRSVHIQGHPEVNCQVLILKRLPPEVSWKELAVEFKLAVPTLSSFYQRQCLPRLRKFAEMEGYDVN